jgi:hypothetical protein
MKRKYIFSLVVIGFMFALALTIGTGYGLYISTSVKGNENAATLECFKVYFSDKDIIELKNIDPVINDEGKEKSPYTLTITNICEDTKELQIRLNVLSDTTFDTKALTLEAAGNIEFDTILYKNLPNTNTTNENVVMSKLIGKIEVGKNETIRTNIKLWFDEMKSPELTKDDIFKAQFELIDTESTIKSTFAETLLDNTKITTETKDYSLASYIEEGLHQVDTTDGKGYYYRGIVNNNYVKFGNYIWRIVAINPDNSVRIVSEKSAASINYSNYTNAIDYTGLKYIYNNEPINNNISNYLEEWYQSNIINTNLDKYIIASSYCNDSSNYINSYHTYFNGYTRLITDKRPTLVCPSTNADFGGLYKQKVGLLSADEVAVAGGVFGTNNYNYYLYNGETFFTMTGADYYNYIANLFIVTNTGAISTAPTTSTYGIRPVINLAPTVTVSGAGTIDNPYTIDIQE